MKRKLLLFAVPLVTSIVGIAGIATVAQEPGAQLRRDSATTSLAAELAKTPGASANSQAALPVSQVVLYSSGVGYFERDGQVTDRAQVDLRFKVESINDLLKSMVVQDFDGGRVSTVTYGSRDPITKTLKSFGIDLTENPNLKELLDQVRGERIEITGSAGQPLTGQILGTETKEEQAGENKVVQNDYLNLLTPEGLRSVQLKGVHQIKLLNEQLNAELNQALAVLATGHDTQKKTVSIAFDGEGKRKVSVSYIMETPIWKTSYRLVLDDDEKPFLQGWAIVENTTDDDWANVKLSLISGRPISFIMDMYQPLYVPRPVIVPELYASLRPQTYGEAMEQAGEALEERVAGRKPAAKDAGIAGEGRGGMMGMGAGGVPAAPPARRMRAESLAADAAVAGFGGRGQLKLQEGVASAAQSMQSGELFEYAIQNPVTLARQKSAMLPIVSEEVDGAKVSIYNQAVQAKYPLNGYRLKNTSQLNLMQGPITVFDGGTYAGDARIEDIAPGQERLISYAMDLKVEVEPVANVHSPELTSVKVRKGTLIATRKAVEEHTYNIKNRDQKKKIVLVEHPYRADWELKEPSEAAERTRDVYRFAAEVEPGKGGRIHVREEHPILENIQLTDTGPDVIAYFMKAEKVSAKVKEALQRVVELRNRVSQTIAERTRKEQRVAEITQEQARIRENMKVLNQNSEVYKNYEKEFVQQDNEIKSVRKEIEAIRATEAKQQKELNDYLLSLDID